MLGKIRRTLRRLQTSTSGNATLLVALGMPALIGGSGLAVDTAQYYMWKRELQFAVDQAALAGAWARSDSSSRSTYTTRATQEFNSNLSTVAGNTSAPSISLGNFNGGSNNAVHVYATASQPLPFTNFVTGRDTTVSAQATATFSDAATYRSCLLAVNPTENRSAIFGNAITGGSNCGVGALSTATQSIYETGDSSIQLGDIISAGGIEDSFSNNGTIHENVTGLSDPYASASAPSSDGMSSRNYECPTASAGTSTWTANQTVRTVVTYTYKKGANSGSASIISYTSGPGYLANSDDTVGPTSMTYSSAPTAGTTVVGPATSGYVAVTGNGQNKIWRAATTTTTTTISNVTGPVITGANDGTARPMPGRYSDIRITCNTEFQSGVYWVSGSIDFGQNKVVTGSNVMFVMTGSSKDIRINSQSNVSLSGITSETLQAAPYNMSQANADKLDRMLFFDKNNTSDFDSNGTATLNFDGVFYMPKRTSKINGTMSTGSRCIMLITDTFWITGNANVSNFCIPSGTDAILLGSQPAQVRLVA